MIAGALAGETTAVCLLLRDIGGKIETLQHAMGQVSPVEGAHAVAAPYPTARSAEEVGEQPLVEPEDRLVEVLAGTAPVILQGGGGKDHLRRWWRGIVERARKRGGDGVRLPVSVEIAHGNLRTNLRTNLRVNLRIPGILSSFSSRFFSSLLFALLFLVEASAQNWAGAEGLLVGKIVSATGPKTMALEVLNRSSLNAALSDDIRRNLLTQLAATGVRFLTAEQAAVSVRVTLSEDLHSYVWVAEIRQDAHPPAVVMVSLPRSGVLAVEPAAAAMVLREVSLWSQPEPILDVAVIEGNPALMLVLDARWRGFQRAAK